MNINIYKRPDGRYFYNECTYYDETELIINGMMGWCGCGMPDEALVYLRDVLQSIEDKNKILDDNRTGKAVLVNAFNESAKIAMKPFTCEGAQMLVYYVLDAKGLTEHGSSVGGCWLTTDGEKLLSDLNEIVKSWNDDKNNS